MQITFLPLAANISIYCSANYCAPLPLLNCSLSSSLYVTYYTDKEYKDFLSALYKKSKTSYSSPHTPVWSKIAFISFQIYKKITISLKAVKMTELHMLKRAREKKRKKPYIPTLCTWHLHFFIHYHNKHNVLSCKNHALAPLRITLQVLTILVCSLWYTADNPEL